MYNTVLWKLKTFRQANVFSFLNPVFLTSCLVFNYVSEMSNSFLFLLCMHRLQLPLNIGPHINMLHVFQKWRQRRSSLNNIKLAHRDLFSTAVFIKPFPIGRGGHDGTVLAPPTVRLQGDDRLPVLEAHALP